MEPATSTQNRMRQPPIFPSNNNRNNNLAPTIYAIRAPQPRFVIALLSVPRKDPRYSSQVNFEYVAGLPRYLARACPLVTRIRSIRLRCNATHRLAFFGPRPGGGHSTARADLRSRRFRSRDPRGCPWSPSPRLAVPYAPALPALEEGSAKKRFRISRSRKDTWQPVPARRGCKDLTPLHLRRH